MEDILQNQAQASQAGPTSPAYQELAEGADVVWIIIPVFNRYHYTEPCLAALAGQEGARLQVVVVDDGSTDGTAERIAEQYPEVICLKTTGDLFWTATVNQGIRYALAQGGDWVMTLNNDVIAPPSFVAQMLQAAKSNPGALIGAYALEGALGGPVAYAGEHHQWWSASFRRLPPRSSGLAAVTHFPGRGLLMSREVLEQIGLFDEEAFPHYMADYELTTRAHKRGLPVLINYDAPLITYPAASGDHALRQTKSWANFQRHLFGIHGGGNLSNFYRFTLRHTPWYALPSALTLGTLRRLLGYWRK